MAINNISNINAGQILNITAQTQSANTSKLSTGYKVNRDDTAATMKLSNHAAANKTENYASSMSNVKDIDKIDEMIANAQKNIRNNPEDAIAAQANQSNSVAISLIN